MMKNFAVIVVYFPDLAQLRELFKCLQRSAAIVVIDNTPGGKHPLSSFKTCRWISIGENIGIAKAQNIGIQEALRLGAESVAFFDQDSQLCSQLHSELVAALQSSACDVAAPVCIDARTGREYPPYRLNRWGWPNPSPVAGMVSPTSADLIISSGSVVKAEVFHHVGLMEESFFIDYVDIEWCIRCRKAGFSIRVFPSQTMIHSIGYQAIRNGCITTFMHSPSRSYYRLRNSFLLLRISHVPRLFALHQIFAALVHHILLSFNSNNLRMYLCIGCRALVDGLSGIRGQL